MLNAKVLLLILNGKKLSGLTGKAGFLKNVAFELSPEGCVGF